MNYVYIMGFLFFLYFELSGEKLEFEENEKIVEFEKEEKIKVLKFFSIVDIFVASELIAFFIIFLLGGDGDHFFEATTLCEFIPNKTAIFFVIQWVKFFLFKYL